jgi:hypothetical protein
MGLLVLFNMIPVEGQVSCRRVAREDHERRKCEWLAENYLTVVGIDSDTLYVMRVPDKKIPKLYRDQVASLQNELTNAGEKFEEGSSIDNLEKIRCGLSFLHLKYEKWVVCYYKKEYNFYKKYEEHYIQQKEKLHSDSIMAEKKRLEDSLGRMRTPYFALEQSLDEASGNSDFTVFYGIDVYFAYLRLNSYLQLTMRLTPIDKGDLNSQTSFVYDYVSSISTENGRPFLTVKYTTKPTKRLPYLKSDENYPCCVITRCEIVGSEDEVVTLFEHYWPKAVLGGSGPDEIAHVRFWGDRVTLYKGKTRNIYKIIITKSDLNMDYYTMYGIK